MANDPMDTMIGAARGDAQASQTHLMAALNAETTGDRDIVLGSLRKSVAADSANSEAIFKLAYHLDLLGEQDEAIALYERCVELAPAHLNALLNVSVLYEDEGDYVRAERCLRQVLETNPNHARANLFIKDVRASKDMVIEEDPDRDLVKRRALMDTPVTDFELTVRARTCLKKMNIRTLGDLLKITEAELMSYKNFGESSLDEIKKMLDDRNLRLGQGLEDAHRAARRQIMEQLKGSGKENMLTRSVSDLQLSVRARKALQMLNIQSLGDLASHTEAELMGVKNFGSTSLIEVRERLAENGLSLRLLDD